MSIVQYITPPQTIPSGGESMKTTMWKKNGQDRRTFIGGSDARIIMGDDEAALVRLWREKRGEVEPENLSGNLIVQLGTVPRISTGAGTSSIPGRS
jgi:hypothetical protein